MAKVAFTDAVIYYAETDISGLANECQLAFDADVVDATTFASGGWREKAVVMKSATWDIKGYLDTTDLTFQDHIGQITAEVPVSLVPFKTTATIAEGDVAYTIGAFRSQYNRPTPLGALARFEITVPSTRSGGRGQVLDYKAAQGATGNSTGRQLGALSATQVLQVNLHVGSGTGTIVFTLESDDNSDFSSATTRATWALSAIGSEMETVAGAVTDDWWRLKYTYTSGTWKFLCCASLI